MTTPKIIVVEDERIVALHLKQQLSKLGYDVVAVAASGDKALQAIAELRPDIVLMDIHIEGDLDGIDTARKIPPELELPVIYLTAYSEEATLERARETRPYGYLVKPFSERELHATIQMALERRRVDTALAASERRLALLARNLQEEISARSRAVIAAQLSEDRFQTIFNAVSEAIFIIDADAGGISEVNEAGASMYGYTPSEMIGHTVEAISSGVPPYTQTDAVKWIEKAAATGQPQTFDWRGKRKDGSLLWAEVSIHFALIGSRRVVISIARDVTKRRAMEDQLRQSQKMEAIGHLAGGMAHDFNNLLAIIHGNLELVMERVSSDHDLSDMVSDALRAAMRGVTLNDQLLSYSRKQPLDPKVINLESLISDTAKLLRRTLGETIEVRTTVSPDLWTTQIDPNQLQNALLNLAVNARDAMPKGGKICIELANKILDEDYCAQNLDVNAGPYVLLSVTDTGSGMTKDVLERVLEPFFTTKGVGQGSGLGLSMVYGFVKQSGGHLKIYSEVGHGTTVNLYLPKAQVSETDENPGDDLDAVPHSVGMEVVLVVEDDDMVRKLALRMLSELGYQTLQAEDGIAAAKILNEASQIDLLLTDVVLPKGVSGPALVRAALVNRPDLRVLYMSGYTRDALGDNGLMGDTGLLLTKPFRKSELARKVRQVLDQEMEA
jgi:PAS domain S-box-containing protein